MRFPENPILRPGDIPSSMPGMKVEGLLNPGVFRFEGKTWLLLRVAERPEQKPGKIINLRSIANPGERPFTPRDK
jgi:predicted GH43/DUF377 family glycosyl hydrolase